MVVYDLRNIFNLTWRLFNTKVHMSFGCWHLNENPCIYIQFFLLTPNNHTHRETASWLRQTEGLGPAVVLVPGAPAGLFVVCLPGWWGEWEVYPQRSLWHQPVPKDKKQPVFLDGCCRSGDVAGQICERNTAGVYEMGQLVSLHVQWLEHRHHNHQCDAFKCPQILL